MMKKIVLYKGGCNICFTSIIFALIIVLSNYLVQFKINDWFTYGAILFPIGFLMIDLIVEKKGKKEGLVVVRNGILIAFPFTLFFIDLRIAFASIVAYYISQNIDIHIFSYLKDKFEKQWYIRNNISTFFSQSVDSFLFFFLAFYGVMELDIIVTLSFGAIAVKYMMAIVDTPFFYLFGVKK